MALTPRQRAFVEQYVALGSGAAAARAAGYKDGPGIYESARRLLRNAEIAEAIDERQANLANELGLTRQYVLQGLAGVVDSPTANDTARVRALELVGKAHGLFADRAIVDQRVEFYTLDMGNPDVGDGLDDDTGDDE